MDEVVVLGKWIIGPFVSARISKIFMKSIVFCIVVYFCDGKWSINEAVFRKRDFEKGDTLDKDKL